MLLAVREEKVTLWKRDFRADRFKNQAGNSALAEFISDAGDDQTPRWRLGEPSADLFVDERRVVCMFPDGSNFEALTKPPDGSESHPT